MARGRRQRDRGENASGIGGRPLQYLHAAHGAADNAEKVLDAEAVEQHRLGAHHVGDGDDGEGEAVGLAGRGVDFLRPGRAHAAADDVLADDEKAVRVDGQAGADHERPPAARLAGDRVAACDMLVARQRMADKHGVGPVGVERAVGLIGDGERREAHPAVERERRFRTESLGRVHRLDRRGASIGLPWGLKLSRLAHRRAIFPSWWKAGSS